MQRVGRWPLPALAAWAACWCAFLALARLGAGSLAALAVAGLLGIGLALMAATPWRRVFVGAGFPLSLAASGTLPVLPAWGWLLPLTLLALLYPARVWRDAPVYPTPQHALTGLARRVPLAPGQAILDVGSGLGAALRELRREYPDVRLHGVEWSWPLRLASAWRCRFAEVRRGDMWAADWSPYDMVYVFQRPENMARAAAKARAELKPGAWLVSLEFGVPGWPADARVDGPTGRTLWLYRLPPASPGRT